MRTVTKKIKGFANMLPNGKMYIFTTEEEARKAASHPLNNSIIIAAKCTSEIEIEEKPIRIYESDLEKAWDELIANKHGAAPFARAENSAAFQSFKEFLLAKREKS